MRSPNASYWSDASTKPAPSPAASAAAWAAAGAARGPWIWAASSASRGAVVRSPNCVAVCRSRTSQAGRPNRRSRSAASRMIEIACDTAPSAAHTQASARDFSESHPRASGSASHCRIGAKSRRASAALPAMASTVANHNRANLFLMRPLWSLPASARDSRHRPCASAKAPRFIADKPATKARHDSTTCHEPSNGTSRVSRRMWAIVASDCVNAPAGR